MRVKYPPTLCFGSGVGLPFTWVGRQLDLGLVVLAFFCRPTVTGHTFSELKMYRLEETWLVIKSVWGFGP